MEKYLLLEDAIRTKLTNIYKKSSFSRTSSKSYRNALIHLKNELKLQILTTDELKHNREIAIRYNEIKNKISLALVRLKEQELEQTLGIVDSEEKPSDSETEEYTDVESASNTESDSESATKNESKMTTALEIIKTASTLIPEFDGNSDHLSRVINAIKAW